MTLGARIGWVGVAILALANLGFALDAAQNTASPTTYVLTPIVDVVPQGAPLQSAEVQALMASLRTPEDPDNVQDAYATLGSTLSLHDLLRGVAALSESDAPLSASQTAAISGALDAAETKHAELIEVQEEILVLEAKLGRDINRVMMRLPAEDRARIVAGIGAQP